AATTSQQLTSLPIAISEPSPFFFFKQKTAYEIGLGIPAEPLFRSKAGKGLLEGTLQAGTSAVSDKLLDLVGLGGKSAADKGKDTRDYLAAAFPELNAWVIGRQPTDRKSVV